MLSRDAKQCFQFEPRQFISRAIVNFSHTSPANQLPSSPEPLFNISEVKFSDTSRLSTTGSEMSPRQVLLKSSGLKPNELPDKLTLISWTLQPTAAANQQSHAERFNNALGEYLVRLLSEMGYLAAIWEGGVVTNLKFRQPRVEQS